MSIMLLDTNSVYLVYLDLTNATKRGLLERTDCGPRALPHLQRMTQRLSTLVQDGKPYAAELAAADKRHDIGCVVLDLACQIHTLLGALPEHAELGARAEQIRATLRMSRALTRASYVDTAATASRNRTALPGCLHTLQAMPIADGLSGADVAELFIGGGEDVRTWLTKRADALAVAASVRKDADGRSFINEARALLTRLRSTLEGEVSWRDDLPADLPGTVFSVLDAQIAAAVAASRGARASGAGQDAVADLQADPGVEPGIEAERDEVDAGPVDAPVAEEPVEAAAPDGQPPLSPLRVPGDA